MVFKNIGKGRMAVLNRMTPLTVRMDVNFHICICKCNFHPTTTGSFAKGRPLRMIVCKKTIPPNDHLQPRKGHEKCIFETLPNDIKCVWVSKNQNSMKNGCKFSHLLVVRAIGAEHPSLMVSLIVKCFLTPPLRTLDPGVEHFNLHKWKEQNVWKSCYVRSPLQAMTIELVPIQTAGQINQSHCRSPH